MHNTKTFPDNPAVAAGFAADLSDWLKSIPSEQTKITIALSGGSTPKLLFQHLAENYADLIDWSRLHFFWGDERCVGPDDPESNYGEANKLLLSHVSIPESNVHRVRGEDDPQAEATRYGQEILEHVSLDKNGIPSFDLIMLGMGGDGHTASIFPHEMNLMTATEVCVVATHPESGQQRVSFSGPVLNAAQKIAFLITGESKASVLAEIFAKSGAWETYPTSYIQPPSGEVTFYTDAAAVSQLDAS
jgi:6-phosphogluconolactonase